MYLGGLNCEKVRPVRTDRGSKLVFPHLKSRSQSPRFGIKSGRNRSVTDQRVLENYRLNYSRGETVGNTLQTWSESSFYVYPPQKLNRNVLKLAKTYKSRFCVVKTCKPTSAGDLTLNIFLYWFKPVWKGSASGFKLGSNSRFQSKCVESSADWTVAVFTEDCKTVVYQWTRKMWHNHASCRTHWKSQFWKFVIAAILDIESTFWFEFGGKSEGSKD